jgi:AcrR family transcriptional regulator
MPEAILTQERILEAAEEVLRRFGPAKTTVVDVARALGVTHGSVYRHFPSKAALRDAVAARWLERVSAPLDAIVAEEGPAAVRLRRWLDALIAIKRSRAFDDPELFATYLAIANDAHEVITAHVAHLAAQAGQIVADGVAQGAFHVADPAAAGRAVVVATSRFHNPAHAAEWRNPAIDTALEEVWSLLLAGLSYRPA